jgi:RNA recognition motif-containing protein
VSPLEKEEFVSIKLYVGNLPMGMTEAELKELFTEAGNVASAKIITDRQTGQPRGFGFVEMETKLEGQKAISMLNGRAVEGRALAVNEARPQARSGGGGGGYGGGGGRGGGGRGGGGGGRGGGYR